MIQYLRKLSYPERIWLIAPFFLVFVLLNFSPLREGDLFWHLKVGEQIIFTKSIPKVDSFSFTANGLPFFFSRSWLGDVLLFSTYQISGLSGLVLLQSIIGATTLGFVLLASINRSANIKYASTSAMIGFIGLYPLSTARPVIFSFLCFSLIIWVLYTYRYQKVNRLWLLPIAMICWVNLNAAWVTGLFVIVVFTGLTFIESTIFKNQISSSKTTLIWGMLGILVILINPLGIGILEDILTATGNSVNQSLISEWQPIQITNPFTWPFFLVIVLLLISFAYSKHIPDWIEFILFLSFLLLSFRFIRIMPFFYIIAIPSLAFLWSRNKIFNPVILHLKDNRKQQINKHSNFRIGLVIGLGMIGISIFSIPLVRISFFGEDELNLVSHLFPRDASNYLEQLQEDDIRLFSQPEWGGYLMWRHFPRMRTFIDGRVEQFPFSVWKDYFMIVNAENNWIEKLLGYEIDYVVLSKIWQSNLISQVEKEELNCPYEDQISKVCKMLNTNLTQNTK